MKATDAINGVPAVKSAITWRLDCGISHYLAFRLSNQPLLGVLTVESAVRAPHECGRAIHLKSTWFVHLLQRFDAGREVEGVMARIVSTNIALEGTFLNRETRWMVEQLKVGIARAGRRWGNCTGIRTHAHG